MSDRSRLVPRVVAPVLVVVEGDDERRIVYELIKRRDPSIDVAAPSYKPRTATPAVQLAYAAGRDFRYLDGLNPIVPGFTSVRRLILVFDAEEEPHETFDSLRAHLRGSGFPLPEQPWQVATAGDQTCVIAVLPDGTSTGSLEAMLLEGVTLAPRGPEQLTCLDQFISCVGQGGDALTARRDKRRLYSWLSVLDEPTRFAGEAASSGALPLNTPQLERLADLILGRP